MFSLIIIVVTVFILFAIFAWTIYLLALRGIDTWIGLVWTGEIKFVVAGQSVVRVIMNVPGYRYDKKTKTIVELGDGEEEKLPWFTKKYGIYWIGFYPFEKVYQYEFEYNSLVSKTVNGKIVRSLEHKHYPAAPSLYWKFIYPVEAEDVELEGNVTVRVAGQITLQVIAPIHLIFILDAKWVERALEATEGLIAGYGRNKKFDAFRLEALENSEDPTKPSLAQFLTGQKLLSTEEIPAGQAITMPAVLIAEARFVEFGYSGPSKDMQDALTENAIAEQDAKAMVTKSAGEATKIKNLADADAHRIRVEGQAKAEALKVQADALKNNPEALNMWLFANGSSMQALQTLVGSNGAVPTFQIPQPTAKKEEKS